MFNNFQSPSKKLPNSKVLPIKPLFYVESQNLVMTYSIIVILLQSFTFFEKKLLVSETTALKFIDILRLY